MRISGKGVVAVLLLLVVLPVVIDLSIAMLLPKKDGQFQMSRLLSAGYLKALPYYLFYVIVVLAIYYLIKKRKKSQHW